MYGLRNSDIKYIQKLLSQHPGVEKAVVFGSRAKGNAKAGSDVDIALIGNNLEESLWQIHDHLEEESPMPYFFDIVDYHKINNPNLISHIDRVGKVLFNRKSS